ncbi:MAG TPA: hypothetical protein VIJ34_02125 [Acidimicrobiales bacterium]
MNTTDPIREEFPEAVEPRYVTATANEEIELYHGTLVADIEGTTLVGNGSVTLKWVPSPQIEFEFAGKPDFEQSDSTVLSFKSLPQSIKLHSPGNEHRGRGQVWGVLLPSFVEGVWLISVRGHLEEFETGNPAPTERILFHVPNLPSFVGETVQSSDSSSVGATRLTAATRSWRVRLDGLDHLPDLYPELNRTNGYGITHVGDVQRIDGSPIPYEEVEQILATLTWWLTMLRSERTGPVLAAGIHEGRTVWELVRIPIIQQWTGPDTWMPRKLRPGFEDASVEGVSTVLDHLADLQPGTEPHRVIERALGWYTQSVQGRDTDAVVITAQAGLELLSWLKLTGDRGVSHDGFEKLPTSDALRITLGEAAVPLDVPDHLEELKRAASLPNSPKADGPEAVVGTRNSVIHPKPKDRFADNGVIFEAGRLAIRYLELLLLHRFGYGGEIHDRTDLLAWSESPAPWARH